MKILRCNHHLLVENKNFKRRIAPYANRAPKDRVKSVQILKKAHARKWPYDSQIPSLFSTKLLFCIIVSISKYG